MGAIADAFNLAFRDFVTPGVPASGPNEPDKSDIRDIGVIIEQMLTASGIANTIYDTALDGLAATSDGDLFLVKGTPPDTFALLFKNVEGAAVYQNLSMPATQFIQEAVADLTSFAANLSSPSGAGLVGTSEGLNLQRALDAEKLTRDLIPGASDTSMAPSYVLDAGLSVPRFDDVIDVVIVMGQSNTGSRNSPPVATAPIYPGRCLMPDIGPRTTAGWRFSSFTDAVESLNSGTGESETPLTSLLSHLVEANDNVIGAPRRKFAGFVSGVGGTGFEGLKRGSMAWQNALDGLEDAVAIARESGYRARVAAICWVHGENHTGGSTTAEQYFNMLQILARDFNADAAEITGQRSNAPLFLMQISTVNNGAGLDQQIQMAQHRAGDTDWGRVVGPLYPYPPAEASGIETIHKTPGGINLIGQCFARAIFAELNGLGWRGLRVKSARPTSSTVIRIECDVPTAPLVIDTAGAVDPTGLQGLYGFDVQLPDGNYATISSATVVNGTAIDLTMAAPITAPWVRVGYAMRRNSGTTEDGPALGARGCVRDSSAGANLFGQGTLRNWLCHWTGVVITGGTF